MSKRIIIPFIAAEVAIYIAFMSSDIFSLHWPDVVLKYSGVLLCLAFSIIVSFMGGDASVVPAMFFTVIADYFLLVASHSYTVGIMFFLAAQIIYAYRITHNGGRMFLPARILLPVVAALILTVLKMHTTLNLLSMIYFSQLIINAISAWTMRSPTKKIFAAGLLLFVGCDICVGIFNTQSLFPDWLYSFSQIGMWLFYLPSQTLIALSAMPGNKERTS